MSHFKERKENNCLNCGAVVCGRYCHLCGQENIEPKETFWHLVTHFVYDITHFDGKFFSTVKLLLLKPGLLSREYMVGRRMRYLNPIKMYVFVSAFFFLFFFSIINPSYQADEKQPEQLTYGELKVKIENKLKYLQTNLQDKENPEFARILMENQVQLLQQDLHTLAKDSTNFSQLNYVKVKGLSIPLTPYTDIAQYDSVQKSLRANERDSWLEKITTRKSIQLQGKYNNNLEVFLKTLFEKFTHSFSQLLFLSLPLFALLLKVLYFRKKTFYYVDHVIYTVHLYCAMFILLFILMSISQLEHYKYLQWVKHLTVPLVIYTIWYQYKSLRNFYEQSRTKTILKYFLLLSLSSVMMSILFILFLVLSIFNL